MLTVALLPRDSHCISAGADPVEMRFEITGGIWRLETDVGCETRDVLSAGWNLRRLQGEEVAVE